MTYNAKMIVYDADGSTPDTSTYASGIVTDVVGMSFTLAQMGGCLGGEFRLPGEIGDSFAIGAGKVVKIWHDSAGSPIYAGRVIGRDATAQMPWHRYELRGVWDQVAEVDTSTWAGATLVGADETGTETTIEDVLERIHTDVLTGTLIGWNAAKIDAAVQIDSLKLHDGIDLKRLFQQLARMAGNGSSYYAIGVDGAMELFCLPISELSGDLQVTTEIGIDVTQAKERPADKPPNVVTVISERRIPSGETNQFFQSRKTYTDATSITTYGRHPRIFARVAGIYQEADLDKFGADWKKRNANTTRKIEDVGHVLGDDAPPIPWSGLARYSDSSRTLNVDLPFYEVTFAFENSVRYRINLGDAAADTWAPSDIFSVAADTLNDPYRDQVWDEQPFDVTDITNPPNGAELFRPTTPGELSGAAPSPGGTALDRGTVMPPHLMTPEYNTSTATGNTIHSVAKIANGGTAFTAGDIVFFYRRLDDNGSEISIPQKTPVRIKTEGEIETWSDAASGYAVQSNDAAIQLGVRVEVSEGTYEYYPSEATGDFDWAEVPAVSTIDPSGGGVQQITQEVQPVGWPVS